MVTPAARREAVAHLSSRVSRSASGGRVQDWSRSSPRYAIAVPGRTTLDPARLRELAAIRRRFGYRRLHILLRREGIIMNHKKLRRLYARNGCRCAAEAAAKEPWAHGLR